MNVLIKGMKMPESCSECRLFVGAWCSALDESDWRAAYNKPPDGKRLKGCPLAETADRPTGEWIRTSNDWIDGTCGARYYPIHCSICNYQTYDDDATNYCPNCGADMRGEEE